MTDFEGMTCDCGGNIEYYDTEIVSEDFKSNDKGTIDEYITIFYKGWCPICNKNYAWYKEYKCIKTFEK